MVRSCGTQEVETRAVVVAMRCRAARPALTSSRSSSPPRCWAEGISERNEIVEEALRQFVEILGSVRYTVQYLHESIRALVDPFILYLKDHMSVYV